MKQKILEDVDALRAVLAAVEDLDANKQSWVFASAMARLGLKGASLGSTGTSPLGTPDQSSQAPDDTSVTPREFMRRKNPQSDVQRVVCLGHYLTKHRNLPHFKTRDLSKLNVEAAQVTFSNLSHAVNNATKQSHYLAAAGGGAKQVSSYGELVVDALPDQAKVKQVEANKPKKRKARKERSKSK